MTNEQFEEIKNRAWDWYCKNMMDWAVETIKDFHNSPKWIKEGVENSLEPDNIQKLLRLSQTRHFEINYTREMEEFFEAKLDGDTDAMIGELCDLVLVAVNAGGFYDENKSSNGVNFCIANVLDYIELPYITPIANLFDHYGYDAYACLCEKLKELETRTGSWNEEDGKWCKDLGAYTIEEAIKIAERETNKGIVEFGNSFGDGYFGFTNVKIKKWYKADFSKCKVGGENA